MHMGLSRERTSSGMTELSEPVREANGYGACEDVDRVIAIALAEVGYREKASNASLDDPLANAGSGNWTKYARDLAAAGYYNGNKNGYAWCECFVDWCFWKAFGPDGQRIQCQTGDLGAACICSMQYYQQQGRCDQDPKAGDQVFFYAGGTVGHTGIVVEVSDGSITVVEGNSSDRVQKLSYPRSSGSIAGYGHPKYDQISASENIPAKPSEADLSGRGGAAERASFADASGKRDDSELGTTRVLVRLPLLKRGSTGPTVESAQAVLIHRGYACGGRRFLGRETPDGDFGPATEKAVRSFQAKTALEPDGEIGADTWKTLLTG